MKRFWLGAVLLVLLLILGILLTLSFWRIHAPLAQTLEAASRQALAGDWEKACAAARQAKACWDKYRNFTAAFADHAPLEEMDALFSQLDMYMSLSWQGEFATLCMQLSSMAAAMEESQAFTWWTLL